VQQRPNLAIQVGPTESLDYSYASQAILWGLGSRSNQGDATIDADTDTTRFYSTNAAGKVNNINDCEKASEEWDAPQ
jgi:hypothetical protein